MATIVNPTPVTAQPFTALWMNRLALHLDLPGQAGSLRADFLPFDGQRLLAGVVASANIPDLAARRAGDAVLDAALLALLAEVARQSQCAAAAKIINVAAPSPSATVTATIHFVSGPPHRIVDCYGLAATDPVFAGILTATLTEIARQAGMTVQ